MHVSKTFQNYKQNLYFCGTKRFTLTHEICTSFENAVGGCIFCSEEDRVPKTARSKQIICSSVYLFKVSHLKQLGG